MTGWLRPQSSEERIFFFREQEEKERVVEGHSIEYFVYGKSNLKRKAKFSSNEQTFYYFANWPVIAESFSSIDLIPHASVDRFFVHPRSYYRHA